MGELNTIGKPLSQDRFEGTLSELEERLSRFKKHEDIIRKVCMLIASIYWYIQYV